MVLITTLLCSKQTNIFLDRKWIISEYYLFRNGAILISTCPLKSDSVHILVNVYLIHLKLKFVPILIFDLSPVFMHMSTRRERILRPAAS